mgnify:CR=1 FL=1
MHNLADRQELEENSKNTDLSIGFHLQEKYRFSGKIIVSLHEKRIRMEIIAKSNRSHVIEDSLRRTEQNLQQLLERITSYGNDRNVQLLQLIDLNLLSSKGAHDEKKIFETLKQSLNFLHHSIFLRVEKKIHEFWKSLSLPYLKFIFSPSSL